MKLSIDAKLIRLALTCQAKADVRYYLNGILFAKNGDIVSTDGHCLAKTSHSWINCDVMEDDVIMRIVGIVPKSAETCFLDTELKTCTCVKGNGQTAKILAIETIEGKFPDYERVIPNKTNVEPTEFIGLNPLYLARAAALTDGSKYNGVKFTFFGENNSVIAEPTSDDWTPGTCVVIMPTRL